MQIKEWIKNLSKTKKIIISVLFVAVIAGAAIGGVTLHSHAVAREAAEVAAEEAAEEALIAEEKAAEEEALEEAEEAAKAAEAEAAAEKAAAEAEEAAKAAEEAAALEAEAEAATTEETEAAAEETTEAVEDTQAETPEQAQVTEEVTAAVTQPVVTAKPKICIDPGHYSGKNVMNFSEGNYCEGDVTLQIGLQIRDILVNQYGFDVVMTREDGNIVIGGEANAAIDDAGKLSKRGELSAGCDLFVSLHINGNSNYANGVDTWSQPNTINKTFVILSTLGQSDSEAIAAANHIGSYVTQVNQSYGISPNTFVENYNPSTYPEVSSALMDTLSTPGTIVQRSGSRGDYYGVLKGATSVGTPGMIVEHAYHTCLDTRLAILNTDIISAWAAADARAIAEAFGY